MHRKLLIALYLGLSLTTAAVADNSISASTAAPVASTTVPDVSTAAVVPTAVSVSTVPTAAVAVSSMTEPVDHIENVYLRRLVGVIRTIDPAAHKLVLEDRDGKLSEFILTKRTRAATEDGHRVNVSVLKPGDRVTIRYVENYNYVRKIDCLSANPSNPDR